MYRRGIREAFTEELMFELGLERCKEFANWFKWEVKIVADRGKKIYECGKDGFVFTNLIYQVNEVALIQEKEYKRREGDMYKEPR